MKRTIYLCVVAVMLVTSVFFTAQAAPTFASVPKVLEFDTMVGVPRPYTGGVNPVRGLSGGGLPWVVSAAYGELQTNGKIEVKVSGLVIDPNDPAAITAGRAGTNPSPTFKAVVSCLSKDASGVPTTVNVSTNLFPATPTGNASIEDIVALPHPCIAPIIFITSPANAWFAATGN